LDENEIAISTVFYPFFADKIGLNFIFTEQNNVHFKESLFYSKDINFIRNTLKNILMLVENKKVSELLKLDDENLVISIENIINNINTKRINYDKLLIFAGNQEFTNQLVLKELN
jgi:hypothetical protein